MRPVSRTRPIDAREDACRSSYRFPPGSGLDYDSTRDHTFVKVAAADTGASALMEDHLKREFALGLHLHRQHAETFYILAGAVNFHVDDDWMAAPGACVHIPPGVLHALDLPVGGTARCLMIFLPAGFDQFLAELAGLSKAQMADDALMDALNTKDEIINLGDAPQRP